MTFTVSGLPLIFFYSENKIVLCLQQSDLATRNYFIVCVENNSSLSICCCLPEVIMHTSRYGLGPRASSASSIERWPYEPAAHLESTPTEHVGSASPPVGGSLPHIELGDALSPQAGSQRDEVVDVGVDVSQDGQALPSSIEASQVLATVHTEEFSSSTPQGSSEDRSHPPDGDTTSPSTQRPRPRDNQLRTSFTIVRLTSVSKSTFDSL